MLLLIDSNDFLEMNPRLLHGIHVLQQDANDNPEGFHTPGYRMSLPNKESMQVVCNLHVLLTVPSRQMVRRLAAVSAEFMELITWRLALQFDIPNDLQDKHYSL